MNEVEKVKRRIQLSFVYEKALEAIVRTWNNPNLDASETAAEMATIAQQALQPTESVPLAQQALDGVEGEGTTPRA